MDGSWPIPSALTGARGLGRFGRCRPSGQGRPQPPRRRLDGELAVARSAGPVLVARRQWAEQFRIGIPVQCPGVRLEDVDAYPLR